MSLLCLRPLSHFSLLTNKREHLSSSNFFFMGSFLITSSSLASLPLWSFTLTTLNYLQFLGFAMLCLASVLCFCWISSLTYFSLDPLFGYFFWPQHLITFFSRKTSVLHPQSLSVSTFMVGLSNLVVIQKGDGWSNSIIRLCILEFRNFITVSLKFWNGCVKGF